MRRGVNCNESTSCDATLTGIMECSVPMQKVQQTRSPNCGLKQSACIVADCYHFWLGPKSPWKAQQANTVPPFKFHQAGFYAFELGVTDDGMCMEMMMCGISVQLCIVYGTGTT